MSVRIKSSVQSVHLFVFALCLIVVLSILYSPSSYTAGKNSHEHRVKQGRKKWMYKSRAYSQSTQWPKHEASEK